MKNYLLVPLSLFLLSCDNQKVHKYETAQVDESLTKEPVEVIVNCEIKLDSKWVSDNIKSIMATSDSCIFQLIDSLKSKAHLNQDYYRSLNEIYTFSDGAISEYFTDVMTELFYNDYKGCSKFLYQNEKSKLNDMLVEALSMEISDSGNEKKKRARIIEIINEKSENEDVKKFMLDLEKRINPKMFD